MRWALCVLTLAGWGCESARNPGGFMKDLVPPTITMTTSADTQPIANGLTFTVAATDNLALNDVRLVFSGGFIDTTDTIFANQIVTTVTLPIAVSFPKTSGAGGNIKIVGRATDGAGNFTQDSLIIFLANVQALRTYLLQPAPGAVAATGKSLPVEVAAAQLAGISRIGFLVSPTTAATDPTPPVDSIVYTLPYADSVDFVDTLNVVQSTGTFTVTGFAEDSTGRRSTTNSVTVTVQSAANDTLPPQVSESLGVRVEVSDSISVHATDPSAISWIGFRVRLSAPPNNVILFDTIPVGGGLTDVVKRFSLSLGSVLATFPTSVLVDGYACDGAARRNCGFSSTNGFVTPPPPADSAQVVAGVTVGLPFGSQIADAIYDKNRGELYLTNTPFSRIEVFQTANTTFVAGGIPVAGPQPWGIALWPHDTLGNYGDSVVVADAGGTELSIVNTASRRLSWRQDLPNYLIEVYKVQNLPQGGYEGQITIYDLSDRPQYVATVCRTGGAPPACAPDSIFAIYSTTPTASSASPFNGAGTIRMEKLVNSTDTTQLFGHMFWEIGQTTANNATDTLRVELIRPGSLYGNYRHTILSACAGVEINLNNFGLGDSTFARNSGNFTAAFMGEGGTSADQYQRAMAYTSKARLSHGAPTFASCVTSPPDTNASDPKAYDQGDNDFDNGMSPAVDVSDFISNTGVRVSSIATNFNGQTNLVRADSIYYLDQGLRLKGSSPVSTGAEGMDMNYLHAFYAGQGGTPGTGSGAADSTNRVVFVADPSGNILVFDTFFYNEIGTIPVRDPIIGPLRVAKDASGNQLLFGVTTTGLVMVRLPTIPNPDPTARLQRIMVPRAPHR
ncbi:MAG TPA: hypothetical protein VN848_06900 [Gemmatimonadales bacterium]|nr:hypothetical protein [Gemmatimonadales bacterium]